jgi:hypothetical protein
MQPKRGYRHYAATQVLINTTKHKVFMKTMQPCRWLSTPCMHRDDYHHHATKQGGYQNYVSTYVVINMEKPAASIRRSYLPISHLFYILQLYSGSRFLQTTGKYVAL